MNHQAKNSNYHYLCRTIMIEIDERISGYRNGREDGSMATTSSFICMTIELYSIAEA